MERVVFEQDPYFQGKVELSFTIPTQGYTDCGLLVETANNAYFWQVTVEKEITDPIQLLEELKKPEYITEGCSTAGTLEEVLAERELA